MKINPDWKKPPIKEFIKTIYFFSKLPDHTIDILIKEAKAYNFDNNKKVILEHEEATGFFIIARGTGTETCEKNHCNFRIKKRVGDAISFHNVISRNFRY